MGFFSFASDLLGNRLKVIPIRLVESQLLAAPAGVGRKEEDEIARTSG
jgi:hypothetical protein